MALKFRRGTDSGRSAITPAEGEPIFTTDTKKLYVGDGSTAGGIAVDTAVSDGDKGDITVSSSGATWTIDNDAVSYAKIQNVSAASRLLGRGSASGSGDVQELTIGTGLTLTGTQLTASGGLGSPTIEVVKSADETVANSTTLINDTDLYCNLTANKVYYFKIILLGKCISGSTSNFKSSVSGNSEGHFTIDYEATPVLLNGTSTLVVPRVNSTSPTLPVVGIINGVCAPTSNTTLQYKWAQNTAFANGNVIMKGSKLQIWEIA